MALAALRAHEHRTVTVYGGAGPRGPLFNLCKTSVDGPHGLPPSATPRNVYVLPLRTVNAMETPPFPLTRAESTTAPSGSSAETRPATNRSPRTRLTYTPMLTGAAWFEQPNAASSTTTTTDRRANRTHAWCPLGTNPISRVSTPTCGMPTPNTVDMLGRRDARRDSCDSLIGSGYATARSNTSVSLGRPSMAAGRIMEVGSCHPAVATGLFVAASTSTRLPSGVASTMVCRRG